MKKAFFELLPEFLQIFLLSRKHRGWSGDYKTWEEANAISSGYDAESIVLKVKESTLKVQSGESVFERDSVLFDHIEYSWPLLAALLLAAAENKGRLHVMDFGGSLGSSYFQNRNYLIHLDQVQWNVIEQKRFVEAGQKEIQTDNLKFYFTPEESIALNGLPQIMVIATCLPYLEQPYNMLKHFLSFNIPYLIVDNTYFNYRPYDRITIQVVPREIYKASYPAWFLDYDKVTSLVEEKYSIVSHHTNDSYIYLDGIKIQFRGFLAKLNNRK